MKLGYFIVELVQSNVQIMSHLSIFVDCRTISVCLFYVFWTCFVDSGQSD